MPPPCKAQWYAHRDRTHKSETPRPAEPPRVYAERMAREKALAVPREAGECLLAGDTTVAAGRRIFPPAASEEDVARFLELLSGRRHRVFAARAPPSSLSGARIVTESL